MTSVSDELYERTALPPEFRWLAESCPRDAWTEEGRIHAMAGHWLEVHGWFREMHAGLVGLTGQWREGMILSPPHWQAQVMPRLQQFLQNLDGHHQRESRLYFPAFAKQEPRIRPGIELLDRDHEAVHVLLERMADAAISFNGALAGGSDVLAPGDALAEAIEAAAPPLARHLHDEEDIVIPVLTLHGDPFEGRHA